MIPETPFAVRLERARQMIAGKAPPTMPAHVRDQVEAAAHESRDVQALMGHVLQLAQPTRGWRQVADRYLDDEQMAHLVAAVLDCQPRTCPHLRRGAPQPAFARLPLRRLDCQRCLSTWRMPPAADADVCDMCRRRLDVPFFTPLIVHMGPTLIMGDVCSQCARALGIGAAARGRST